MTTARPYNSKTPAISPTPTPETRTVSVGIYAFSGGSTMNVVVAAAVIAAIPTIIFFLIFQKHIMSGLTAGSVKG